MSLGKTRPRDFEDLSKKNPTWHDGMALTEAAVAEIKPLHQGNELTLAEIGARYGVSATAISRLARTQGWPSRSARPRALLLPAGDGEGTGAAGAPVLRHDQQDARADGEGHG